MRSYSLVISLEKCRFGEREIKFLGHCVNKDGLLPLAAKIEAIQSYPKSITVKSLKQYHGMVNFYHRFISSAVTTLQPLLRALEGKEKMFVNIMNRHSFQQIEASVSRCHDVGSFLH